MSAALQQATADVVSGTSVDDAATATRRPSRRMSETDEVAGGCRRPRLDPRRREPTPSRGPALGDAAGLGRARAGGFVAPALLLIGVFLVFPALWTIYLGLTDYRLTGVAAADPQFVGLQNYTTALSDALFPTRCG